MPYLYLSLSVFLSASSSILAKIFNRKNAGKKDTSAFYGFWIMLSACLGWAIFWITDFSFNANVLWYSLAYAACYAITVAGSINALKHGPIALTTLMNSLSLILTTIWGFIFWGSTLNITVVIGLLLVICSITLCLYSKKTEEKKISTKWLVYVLLAFFGNAGCSIVQRTQQTEYAGAYGKQLMFFAILLSASVYLFIYLKSNRIDTPAMLKTSVWLPVCAALLNLVLNVFVMLLANTELSPSLIYPVIGVGSLAVTLVFSLFVFKEKMHWRQWVGVGIGAVAVLLLSINK